MRYPMRYKVFGRRTGLRAPAVRLSADHLRRLDEVSAVPPGFPHELLTRFQGLAQQIAGGKADLLDPATVAVP
ncbi:MAG: hypothetical protein L0221_12365 [Chloroflexi bacterium]|nr:hypothetical protein [Chloroflexota bacterium]